MYIQLLIFVMADGKGCCFAVAFERESRNLGIVNELASVRGFGANAF